MPGLQGDAQRKNSAAAGHCDTQANRTVRPPSAVVIGFAFPEPQRGGMMVAQGKAAEAAALGNADPTSHFPLLPVGRAGQPAGAANRQKGKGYSIARPEPEVALVPPLPRAILMASVRDSVSARFARKIR